MKVLFHGSVFSEKLLLNIEDAQALMGLLSRARAVKSAYVSGKGYVHTYVPKTESGEFALVLEDEVQMPDDLKTMVQVKRGMMSERGNQLPESYVVPGTGVIPDEGVNVE